MIKMLRQNDAKIILNRNRQISRLLTKANTSGLAKTWTNSKKNGQWNQLLSVVSLIMNKRSKSSKLTSEEKRDMQYSLRSTHISMPMGKSKLLLWTEAGYPQISKTMDSTTKALILVQSLAFSTEGRLRPSMQLRTLPKPVTGTLWTLLTVLWSCN